MSTLTARRPTSLEALCVLLLAVIVLRGPLAALLAPDRVQVASTVFVAICVQATPFLVFGVLVSGAIAAFVPPSALARLLPRRESAAVGVAGLAGAALPGCECASVPVARRLMASGVPVSAALAFLLSAPAINPVVLVATAVAFPDAPQMVLARLGASLATAVVMGMAWARFGRPGWMLPAVSARAEATGPRWRVFTETARHDFLAAGGFLVLGALFAAVLHVLVPGGVYDRLGAHLILAIVVMALLAVVLALCSEADAFVVASFSSLPLLPRLVFLVVGPAVDVKLFALQAGTFGRAFAVRFAPATLLVAVACACLVGAPLLWVFG